MLQTFTFPFTRIDMLKNPPGSKPGNRLILKVSICLALLSPIETEAGRITLGPFYTLDGEYDVTFDPATISEEQMKKLIQLSPALSKDYVLAPALELCVSGDPKYLDCETRDWRAVNFYKNAQVNLDQGRKALEFLTSLKYPKELNGVVRYLTASLSMDLWLQETRYEFLKSWDTNILKRKYGEVDPSQVCPTILKDIETITSKQEKYALSKYKWQNCLNHPFRVRLGDYPLQDWKKFIVAYRIQEGPRVKAILEKANKLEDRKAYDKAMALYQKIIKEYPDAVKEDEIDSMKYSDMAKDRISVITCRQKRGLDFLAASPEEISLKIKDALIRADRKDLVALASCDFDVGPLESDNIFSISPEAFVAGLQRNLKDLDFSSSKLNPFTQEKWIWEVPNTKHSERHAFFFKKFGKGWTWISFATSNDSLFEALYKQKLSSSH